MAARQVDRPKITQWPAKEKQIIILINFQPNEESSLTANQPLGSTRPRLGKTPRNSEVVKAGKR